MAWNPETRWDIQDLFAEFTHRVHEVELALEIGKANRQHYWKTWWFSNPEKVKQYRKTCYLNRCADPERAERQRKHNREYARRQREKKRGLQRPTHNF